VPQFAQLDVQSILTWQEWKDRRTAFLDSAASFDQPGIGPKVFFRAIQRIDGTFTMACGHIHLGHIQMQLQFFALHLQCGLAQFGGFGPLPFRPGDGQSEERQIIRVGALDLDTPAQFHQRSLRISALQKLYALLERGKCLDFCHRCLPSISRLAGCSGTAERCTRAEEMCAQGSSLKKAWAKRYWSEEQVGS